MAMLHTQATPEPAAGAAGLRAQQLAFCDALLGADVADGLLRPARGAGAARIDVYRHAYGARLAEALGDNHEVLRRALGDAGFARLAEAYLAAHPSRRPSIRWFGDGLADFMAARWAAGDGQGLVPHPALVDLARLDWALRSAFDAADAPVIAADALAAQAAECWPALCLRLHPSVQLLRLSWCVAPAWHALRQAPEGQEPDMPPPEARVHTLLVWRRGGGTHWRALSDHEAVLLQQAAAGATLAALFEPAGQAADADVDADGALRQVSAWLAQWLADGLVSALQPEPDGEADAPLRPQSL